MPKILLNPPKSRIMVKESHTAALVGGRSTRGSIDPMSLLDQSKDIKALLDSLQGPPLPTITDIKKRYSEVCRLYYSLAAVSRRKVMDDDLRASILKILFHVRSSLERAIVSELRMIPNQDLVISAATANSFFGYSAKQGVSIRFPLMSCVPTTLCGGRCYAHDGRDRDIHIIFRASLNYYLAGKYEDGDDSTRSQIIQRLDKAIKYGIDRAVLDQRLAAEDGFIREPRIRFSHIGDMVATPEFATALALEIGKRNREVQCVMYTRRPDAWKIDSSVFVINFSIDGSQDKRRRYAPKDSRIVCSGWDGKTTGIADVTFLEHHVEKISIPTGVGWICPVTVNHEALSSCDEAKCDRCFNHP